MFHANLAALMAHQRFAFRFLYPNVMLQGGGEGSAESVKSEIVLLAPQAGELIRQVRGAKVAPQVNRVLTMAPNAPS